MTESGHLTQPAIWRYRRSFWAYRRQLQRLSPKLQSNETGCGFRHNTNCCG